MVYTGYLRWVHGRLCTVITRFSDPEPIVGVARRDHFDVSCSSLGTPGLVSLVSNDKLVSHLVTDLHLCFYSSGLLFLCCFYVVLCSRTDNHVSHSPCVSCVLLG